MQKRGPATLFWLRVAGLNGLAAETTKMQRYRSKRGPLQVVLYQRFILLSHRTLNAEPLASGHTPVFTQGKQYNLLSVIPPYLIFDPP